MTPTVVRPVYAAHAEGLPMITCLPGRALGLAALCLAVSAAPICAQAPTAPPSGVPTSAVPLATPQVPLSTPQVPLATPQVPPAWPHEPAPDAAHVEHGEAAEAAHEEAEGESGFYVHTEYLLLQPHRRAADFAISSVDPNRPLGTVESLYWDADSGFRVGAGYRLADGWQFEALYTYFHSTKHRDLSQPANGGLFPTLTAPSDGAFDSSLTSASGDTNINLNVVDLTLGHLNHASHGLEYTLSAGVRYARIDQNLSALYNGPGLLNDFVNSPVRFEGGGLVARAEGCWTFWRRLGVYASLTGSLLSGDQRSTLFEGTAAGQVYVNVTDHFRQVVPVAEMGLGLCWQSESFKARVGYEMDNWFGLIQSPDFVSDVTNKYSTRTGDLSLDGLSVMLEFDF